MRSRHHGSSGSAAVDPTPGSPSLRPFPLRPRPSALGARRGPVERRWRRDPLRRQLSPSPRVAPVPRAVLAGHPSTPRPASVPAVSAPSSQGLRVGTSPCALGEAMSRGPGPGPEPRLVAEPREKAPALPGRPGSVARSAQAPRLLRTGPAPCRHVTVRDARASAGPRGRRTGALSIERSAGRMGPGALSKCAAGRNFHLFCFSYL